MRQLVRLFLLLVLLCAPAVVAACGGGLEDSPIERQVADDEREANPLGFPLLATKNTTRVDGKDPVDDAAAVARAVYPAFSPGQRPDAVVLVDKKQWPAAFAAAVLMSEPLRAPVLLTDGGDLPERTADALDSLKPTGTALAGRAQAFTIGAARAPKGLRAQAIRASDPVALAAEVDAAAARIMGRRSSNVVVAGTVDPRFAMPAASWAAKSGDALLFAEPDKLPEPTRRALERRDEPNIYVLGPRSMVGDAVVRSLSRLGRVRRIAGDSPVTNAIAFARYTDRGFGWGVRDPGHGLVFANESRPLDAVAAAPLGASGTYGPLLLTNSASVLPASLRSYLLDIQPGYSSDPVRGVYNHAWLLGDESAIGTAVQGEIDELTEIVRVKVGQTQ